MEASVLARLKNQARKEGISYQIGLQLFFQEEFLRRLSTSRFRDNMVLKGGMFIYILTQFDSRPTRDMDFMIHYVIKCTKQFMFICGYFSGSFATDFFSFIVAIFLRSNISTYFALIYLDDRDEPILFTVPFFTIAPSTASTVVGLTSGRILQISDLESGVKLFRTVASIRAFFVIFFP